MKRLVSTYLSLYLKRLTREKKKADKIFLWKETKKDPKSTCDLMNQITGVFLWRYVT